MSMHPSLIFITQGIRLPNPPLLSIDQSMPKLLVDFLQEQQEPFALEAYLVERGCSRQRCRMHNNSINNNNNNNNNYYYDKEAPPNCSEFLRGVLRQLKFGDKGNAGGNGDGVSTASSSTTLFLEGEVNADINFKLRAEEERKQLSPVSVLDEEDSPLHFKHYNLKARGVGFEESREVNPYDEYITNKKGLQHRKQLQELLGKCSKKKKREDRMLGGEKVWIWSQDSINETNILHLLHPEFMDAWGVDFEEQRLEISMEIENDILECVVNEMVLP